MHSGQRLVFRKLRTENVRSGFECFRVFRCPPIAQRARRVDLAALIIEAVRKFVTDNSAGCAVIDRGIGIRIENRRLKNSRRENNVAQASVVSIVRLRRHTPIGPIDRAREATSVKIPIQCRAALDVAD